MRARHCEDGREETLRRAWGLLLALGAAPTYAGFRQAAAAACAAAGRPELLLSLSKWLYPLVAEEQGTTAAAVERNIRTLIDRVWRRSPELLRQAGFAGEQRPTCGEFVGLLAARLAGAERA